MSEYGRDYDRSLRRTSEPRNPTKASLSDGARRRRIEDIKDAANLERTALLDVWELTAREFRQVTT